MKWIIGILSVLWVGNVWAASIPFNYHAESKMIHGLYGPVDKMYGYVDVHFGSDKKGTINVKFSNGRQLEGATFNADVKFLDASGALVKKEHFQSDFGPAGFYGAVEREQARQIVGFDFDRVEVRFYLENPDDYNVTIPLRGLEDKFRRLMVY